MTKTRHHHGSDGFTLVELMIVVAILGLLASVALPVFDRYVRKARTVEAVSMIEKISIGAIAYYMADHVDANGTVVDRQFPGGSSVSTEATVCCPGWGGNSKNMCAGNHVVYTMSPWRELNFGIAEDHRFVPVALAAPDNKINFWVFARGDIDCDNVRSEYHMKLEVVSTATGKDVRRPGGLRIVNDLE